MDGYHQHEKGGEFCHLCPFAGHRHNFSRLCSCAGSGETSRIVKAQIRLRTRFTVVC
jgi:hypothetical protein